MKSILLTLALIICMTGYTQVDTTADVPESTGFGIPDGKSVSKEIGTAGGVISSEDGRVTLTFPEGALAENTTISVTPTTNLAPNATGKAYQFEPSGIQFRKPVEIVFHYTDDEAEICPPELMGIALQDSHGKWSITEYEDWDSTKKALKGFIHHFSSASNVNLLMLSPDKNEIRVGQSVRVLIMEPFKKSGIRMEAMVHMDQPVTWFANNVHMGDKPNGFLTVVEESSNGSMLKISEATYTAPQFLTAKNPVTIRADLYVFSDKKKVYHRARSLKCKINIYDEYEIKITGVWDNTSLGMGTTRFTDTASLRFKIQRIPTSKTALLIRYKPTDVYNTLLRLEKWNCPPKCRCDYMNKDYCEGIIHIAEVEDINITEESDAGMKVFMRFRPAKMTLPLLKLSCPGINNYLPAPPASLPAIPGGLIFDLKEGEQEIYKEDALGIKAKLAVTRVRE